MGSLIRDLRYAVRTLFQHPGFTAVALLSLALGIGANTTIFSVLNTIVLHPFPLKDPDRLVLLFERNLKGRGQRNPTFATFLEWKKQSRVFEDMALLGLGFGPGPGVTLTGAGEAVRIRSHFSTTNLLPLLGASPVIGRPFLPEDIPVGETGSATVVISYDFWQRQFGGDPGVLGRTVTIEEQQRTIVGVMPRGFWVFPWQKDVDAWLASNPSWLSRLRTPLARLKPGVTLQQAQAEMDMLAKRLEESSPNTNKGWGVRVEPLQEWAVGGYRRTLYLLLGAVGFVLLIACANVANLLLTRAAMRQKEIAVRASLGASRLRLMRQLLTESTFLALLGGALGVLVALWGIEIFVALTPQWFARTSEISIDRTVFGFTLGTAVFTGILFGLAPALEASKPDLNESLKETGSRSGGGSRHRFRSALVVSEVALALVLLVGAGLMINSFLRLQSVDLGFDPENLLTVDIYPTGPKYWRQMPGDLKRVTPQGALFFQEVLQRLEALPGVVSASIAHRAHLRPAPRRFTIGGQPAPPRSEQPLVQYREVSAGYFRTMGIPLLKGRYLSGWDTESSPWVIVINEAMAKQFFPSEDPIGKVLHLAIHERDLEEDRPRQIVGVVGDVKHWTLYGDPQPVMYGSYRQHPSEYPGGWHNAHLWKDLVIRTASDPMSLAGAVRRIVAEVDRDQPVYDIMSMEQILSQWVAPQRFWMRLFGIFAWLAVLLAMVGIYGVMSYSVSRRTHEIGVRMAMGAQRRDVLKLVLRQGLKLTLIGVAIGVCGALALTRLIARFLYDVKPTDPLTFVAVSFLLTAVALGACYIPARRASNVDPMVALRHE